MAPSPSLEYAALTAVLEHGSHLHARVLLAAAMRVRVSHVFTPRLTVEREPVGAVLRALRDSRLSLRELALSTDACRTLTCTSAEQTADLGAALRALKGGVHASIRPDDAPSPGYYAQELAAYGMPASMFPRDMLQNPLPLARLLLDNGIHCVSLPPLTLLCDNIKIMAYWDLQNAVLSQAPARVRCSDLMLDFNRVDEQYFQLYDDDVEDDVDLSTDQLKELLEQMGNTLARLPVKTLSLCFGEDAFIPPLDFLRSMPISRIRIVENDIAEMYNGADARPDAAFIADNLGIRAVELYAQCFHEEEEYSSFAYLRALLGNPAPVWPDGVLLFSGKLGKDPPATWPLDETLGRLRVGSRLCLDLLNVSWQPSTLRALCLALERNVDVRHLQLSVLHLTTSPLREGEERVLDLPPHVTSADLHMNRRAFNFIFGRGTSLPGLEALELTFSDAMGSSLNGLGNLLLGAPRLKQLTVRVSDFYNTRGLVDVIVHDAPPTCVDVSIRVSDSGVGVRFMDSVVEEGLRKKCPRIRWEYRVCSMDDRRYTP